MYLLKNGHVVDPVTNTDEFESSENKVHDEQSSFKSDSSCLFIFIIQKSADFHAPHIKL